jgi:four helix bundle protein
MATALEDLRVLGAAEALADAVWSRVVKWDELARSVVGLQFARAADSIGANVAEAFGRFHFNEKLQFMYYARGSLFETKFWTNRALARSLLPATEGQVYSSQLNLIARQLNAFAASLKQQRLEAPKARRSNTTLRESRAEYGSEAGRDATLPLFDDDDLLWLLRDPEQSPISNL